MEQVILVDGLDHPFLLDEPSIERRRQARLSFEDLSILFILIVQVLLFFQQILANLVQCIKEKKK